jgi:hypothetical protein
MKEIKSFNYIKERKKQITYQLTKTSSSISDKDVSNPSINLGLFLQTSLTRPIASSSRASGGMWEGVHSPNK